MKITSLLAIGFAVLFSSVDARACSCGGPDNFADTARQSLEQSVSVAEGARPFIGTVKILSHEGRTMKVEVTESFMGVASAGQKLTVRGDDGMSCSPYVTHFPIGSSWLLQLVASRSDVYDVSICGKHYLPLKDGQILGRLYKDDSNETLSPPSAVAALATELEREAGEQGDQN